jgi:hypothetical protein
LQKRRIFFFFFCRSERRPLAPWRSLESGPETRRKYHRFTYNSLN